MSAAQLTPEQVAAADLRWLRNAEHWSDGWVRFDETTGERELIWMLKSNAGPQTRFYAKGKGQIGPCHGGVYQATLWAYGSGYLPAQAYHDNAEMFLALACRAEVAAGGAVDDRHASDTAVAPA